MHILITDTTGRQHSVKKSDIRRVYSTLGNSAEAIISFVSPKINTAITVPMSVSEFHSKHLVK